MKCGWPSCHGCEACDTPPTIFEFENETLPAGWTNGAASLCGYDATHPTLAWTHMVEATPNAYTGPNGGPVNGSGAFWFCNVSAAPEVGEGDVFTLVYDGRECTERGLTIQYVDFFVHMFGANIGTLSLYDGECNEHWSKSGDHGPAWFETRVEVYSTSFFFEYKTGDGWQSDAAITNIGIGCWDGPPSPPALPPPPPAPPPVDVANVDGECAWDAVDKCYPSTGLCQKTICQCCNYRGDIYAGGQCWGVGCVSCCHNPAFEKQAQQAQQVQRAQQAQQAQAQTTQEAQATQQEAQATQEGKETDRDAAGAAAKAEREAKVEAKWAEVRAEREAQRAKERDERIAQERAGRAHRTSRQAAHSVPIVPTHIVAEHINVEHASHMVKGQHTSTPRRAHNHHKMQEEKPHF